MATLTAFEGRPVLSAGIEIRNAAGGLNEALGIDPEEWHHEDELTVVMRCKVTKLRFDPVKDTDGFKRVHILTADTATVIDADVVQEALDAQERALEEARGIQRLPMDGEGEGDEPQAAEA